MEMYADVEARGGILEPPGICEVKFRKADQLKTMHRLDAQLVALDKDPDANKEAIKAREEQLLPVYLQVHTPTSTSTHTELQHSSLRH